MFSLRTKSDALLVYAEGAPCMMNRDDVPGYESGDTWLSGLGQLAMSVRARGDVLGLAHRKDQYAQLLGTYGRPRKTDELKNRSRG